MKFLHFADLHFDAPNREAALKSLTEIHRVGCERKVGFWVCAGDLFNRGVANTEASGFPRLVSIIQEMLDVAPIVAVEGTRTSHDLPGCYAVLTQLKARNDFLLLDPGETVILGWEDEKVLVMGCPEPTREWIVAQNGGASAEELQKKLAGSLREIFLGLGAKRAEHPEMPAVMIYHGAVVGAAMENQKLVVGELAIGRDDLALCNADYYALGHIHNRQQISGLPAWYVDSSYPVDWGERKKKHFNLVELEQSYAEAEDHEFADHSGDRWTWNAKVEAVPYPHAPRRKIEVNWGDDITPHLPVRDDLVWLCVRTPKEHCTNEDREIVLAKLMANGAAEGSRVTLEPVASETVRAAEIAKKSKLRDKLAIWAESSGETISEHVFELADWLEAQAERSGALPTSFLYHLRSVKVRGAKGIWKGLRVDDVEIDFDTLDPGLIAFIGSNGEGKTTLAENCHPYSCMMTRAGVLQDHFRLRDSLREVIFSNDATAEWYRSRMEIDGKNKTGAAKYHLARKHPDTGVWEPISDGTKDSYDAAILQLLGSFELFTRSAFVPQRPSKARPSLYEATKGEKKDIFRELAGQDYLQGYSVGAGVQADTNENTLQSQRQLLSQLEQKITTGDSDKRAISILTGDLAAATKKSAELQAAELKESNRVDELEAKHKEQLVEESKLLGIDERISQVTREGQAARSTVEAEQKIVNDAPAAEKRLAEVETLRASEAKENERILEASKARNRISGEWTATLTAHQAHVAEIEGRASKLRTQKAVVAGDQQTLHAQIELIAKDIEKPLSDRCPRCGQTLPPAELAEERRKRTVTEESLRKLRERYGLGEHILASLETDLKGIAAEQAAIIPPTKPKELELVIDDKELQSIRKKIAALNPEASRKTVDSTRGSQAKIEEAEKTITRLRAELTSRRAEREQIAKKIDPKLEDSIAKAKEQHAAARKASREGAEAAAGIKAKIQAAQERLAEQPALEAQKLEASGRIVELETKIGEWRLLERACGPDGIQALELDAMAPGISEIANNLLRDAYGPRFSIEFRTTRSAGKGGKAHQVEDFSIWVLDADCPEIPEAELSMVSGGEGVWIARAIADAFAMIRERNHGVKFLTVIQDEGDSALDDDPRTNARQKYFDMLESGHAESGRVHTLVITHSPEAKDRIRQKVKMTDLIVENVDAAIA